LSRNALAFQETGGAGSTPGFDKRHRLEQVDDN
jgi:hypothetical protein